MTPTLRGRDDRAIPWMSHVYMCVCGCAGERTKQWSPRQRIQRGRVGHVLVNKIHPARHLHDVLCNLRFCHEFLSLDVRHEVIKHVATVDKFHQDVAAQAHTINVSTTLGHDEPMIQAAPTQVTEKA
jgi:hypothetical protein